MAFSFNQIAPYLGAVGNELINLDENLTGADDFAGNLLVYVAEVGQAIQNGEDIPEIPEIVRKGTTDKVSGPLKATLRIASSALTVAQFSVKGKTSSVIKYLNQVLRALIAGQTVPTAPSALIQEIKRAIDRSPNVERLDQIESVVESLAARSDKREKFEARLVAVEESLKSLQQESSLSPGPA